MSRIVDLEKYRDEKRFMEELEQEMNTLMHSEEIEEGSHLDNVLKEMEEEVISISVLKKDDVYIVRIHHLDYTQEPPVLQHMTIKRKDIRELASSLSEIDNYLPEEEFT
jgi:hypothetical protein